MLALRALSPDDIGVAVTIDDDACALYPTAGVVLDLAPDHPFARAEYARWTRAARDGLAFVAGEPARALLVLGHVDGLPYLDQLFELPSGYLTNGHSVHVERPMHFRILGHAESGLSYPTGVMLFRQR